MGNIFNPDFKEFVRALNESYVEYILVGGYSVILHGHSRTTGDMDIWVTRTSENHSRIEKAFNKFGMPLFDMTLNNFLDPTKFDVFRFGRKPAIHFSLSNILFSTMCRPMVFPVRKPCGILHSSYSTSSPKLN